VKTEIRILVVEDVAADVVAINHELRQGGFNFRAKRVETKEAFLHELQHHRPDLILSDHGLPAFDGFTALAIAKDKCADVPFIFVTGALGEATTIDTFESGATDYVLKHRMSKLAPAVHRALREAEERAKRRQAEQALRESEERFRMLVEGVKDYAIFMLDPNGCVTSWNAGAEWINGYRSEEILGQPFSRFYAPEDLKAGRHELALRMATAEGRFEEDGLRVAKSGEKFWANVVITALRGADGQLRGFAQVTRDITQRRRAEEALHGSEERWRQLVEHCPVALFVVLADDRIVFVNAAAVGLLGAASREQIIGQFLPQFFAPAERRRALSRIRQLRERGPLAPVLEATMARLDGVAIDVEMSATALTFQDQPALQLLIRDVTAHKKADGALRRSEARKAAILESALDAIISIDHEGKVQEWNPAAERMFGYRRAAALGRSMDDLIVPPSLRETYLPGLADYLMSGAGSLLGRPIELSVRRADGVEFPAELAITRIPGSEPPAFTTFIHDLTARKQAEEELRKSEARFRMLVEEVKDYAIYMLDSQGRVATWNAGAEHLEGYRAEEIIGKNFSIFFTPEDVEGGVPSEALRRAAEEGHAHNEGWRARKDGSRFWTQGIITALRDESGRLYGFSKVAHDMTAQKKAEAEVRQLNAELEQRVIERTAELQAVNKELEAFSYSVSHNLRTPVRHINAFVEMLEQSSADRLDAESRRKLETIAGAAQQMGKLIDDLLEFSRLGRAKLRKTTVNLAELVRAAQQDLRREMEGRPIEWIVGDLPEVSGDPSLLRQVLVNLISNALKYTRTRQPARIEIGCLDVEKEVVFIDTKKAFVFYIRDNGVGFNMEYAHKLFGAFQRLHRPAEFEGTGVGLAIVRRIIQRHEGRTWAEGEVDAGATFFFSLPEENGGRTENRG
jgi:PAS domain S-box-containing protein